MLLAAARDGHIQPYRGHRRFQRQRLLGRPHIDADRAAADKNSVAFGIRRRYRVPQPSEKRDMTRVVFIVAPRQMLRAMPRKTGRKLFERIIRQSNHHMNSVPKQPPGVKKGRLISGQPIVRLPASLGAEQGRQANRRGRRTRPERLVHREGRAP